MVSYMTVQPEQTTGVSQKNFLMCQPKFLVCYVINPGWKEIRKVNNELAQQQWKNLHDIVAGLASVSLIEPVPAT